MILRLTLAILMLLLLQQPASANPTQFGSSGLLNVPSADTLDSANFCFGIWGNCSNYGNTVTSTIIPLTLTLGIGTFWEVYGTYPNAALNNDTQTSGRGTADIGTKLRFYGSRNSKFKLSADINLRRYIDDDIRFNGINDIGGRLIASLRLELMAAHIYSGYMSNGQSRAVVNGYNDSASGGLTTGLVTVRKAGNEFPVGAGLEYSTSNRSRAIFEVMAADAANLDAPIEAALGFQYYLTPHLTFNLSYALGLNETAADWRVLVGLTTCQGVGAYIKPIPEVRRKGEKGAGEAAKITKIIPLSSLLTKTSPAVALESKFEIPVDAEGDEILVRPYGTVVIPQQPALAKPGATRADSPDQRPAGGDEPSPAQPVIIPEGETSTEYSITKVSGVTPLYGVRLKGPKVVTQTTTDTQSPVSSYRKFRVPDNLFEFDNVEMIPEVQKAVSELAEFIRKDSKWVFLRIDGHTDGVGSVKYNMDLSLKRAISVANYLITREGIDPSRIFVRGMGKTAPIGDNNTEEGRKLNRRFEIIFLIHKDKSK
jgi:outer membrane protein OmpA-like peptidoglycan-associated protein